MNRTAILMTMMTLCLLSAAFAATGDWPQWRGENRDGKSPCTGLLKQWPSGGPKELWSYTDLGSGFSSPTVADGVVYATGLQGDTLTLHAINEKDGKKIWSVPVGPGFTGGRGRYPGSRSAPTVDDGRVYIETGKGLVSCHDIKNGRKIWSLDMVAKCGGRVPSWGYSESVLIVGELAIVTPGGGQMGLVALNKKTGRPVWRSQAFGGAQYSSPIHVVFQGIPMIIQGLHNGLIAVNAQNGKTFWTNGFSQRNTANCPTPAYSDGYVFWANGYGKGGICLKLERKGSSVTAEEVYTTKNMVTHHGGYVIQDGCVYGHSDRGNWTCLDLKTGDVKWQERGVGKGSVAWADNMLYMFSERGGLIALGTASPDGLKMSGEFRVKGSAQSWAHPVVANDKLFVRYDTNLYCFDIKAE